MTSTIKLSFIVSLIVCLSVLSPACVQSPAVDNAGAQSPAVNDAAPVADGAAEVSPNETPLSGLAFPYVTHHQGDFNGRSTAYTATIAAIEVRDADGGPGASIVSTAYVADLPTGSSARPVMFVFNGGPIAPSVYLHMGAFGPKRVAFADDLSADPESAALIENPYSILDVCDLVYFDPAGTGFSRALADKPLNEYFSVEADAQQTAAFIVAWLEENDRTGSPTYIFGESYGTNRAAETAGQLSKLDPPTLLDGVILFGQAVNIIEYSQRPSNIISYVVSLPTLAALGWYHGKAVTHGADLEAFVAEAWEYAQDDYLNALFQGNQLPARQMASVANRLEEFTGISADVFVDKRLRLSKEAYRGELFKADEKIIGMSDGRYVAPLKPAGDDGGEGPGDPARMIATALIDAFHRYLTTDLGVPSAEQYVTGSPVKGLGGWAWGGTSPFSWYQYGDAVSLLLQANPQAKVLVSAGYYDTMTTWGASQYLVNQETWPKEQVSLKGYPGGHMAYSLDASARAMAEDLRQLIGAAAEDK
jgi:carboxypeptidase C (cathepsin A)